MVAYTVAIWSASPPLVQNERRGKHHGDTGTRAQDIDRAFSMLARRLRKSNVQHTYTANHDNSDNQQQSQLQQQSRSEKTGGWLAHTRGEKRGARSPEGVHLKLSSVSFEAAQPCPCQNKKSSERESTKPRVHPNANQANMKHR